MKLNKANILLSLVLLLIAVLSFTEGGRYFSEPQTYRKLISSIDKKAGDAVQLTGVVTIASAAVTLLPDDVATPVADKLADFTQYFIAALCVLFAEKYMMPLIGLAVFRFLLPAVCLLLILWNLWGRGRALGTLSLRLLIFSLILWIAIPASIKASDIIYDTYRSSITTSISEAEELTQDVSVFLSPNKTNFFEKATSLVDHLAETLAVTVATSCIIPILVLILIIWLSKILLGATFDIPALPHKSQHRSQKLLKEEP